MVNDEMPERRWWRKKRWWAAGLLWLAFGYVLTEGPATYAVVRGWLPPAPVSAAYLPAGLTVGRTPLLAPAREAHRSWWYNLGLRHRPQVISYSGPSGWTAVVSSDTEFGKAKSKWGRDFDTFEVNLGNRKIELFVENAQTRRDAGEGRVMLDGRRVATVPAGVQRLSIEFIGGDLSIEADGKRVPVDD